MKQAAVAADITEEYNSLFNTQYRCIKSIASGMCDNAKYISTYNEHRCSSKKMRHIAI